MISDKYRTIMTRIPKSASTSMEFALTGSLSDGWDETHLLWRQHATLLEIKKIYATSEQFSSYFKFGFVRNPWGRLLSSFYFWNFPVNLEKRYHKDLFTAFVLQRGVFTRKDLRDICDPELYHTKNNIYHHLRPQYQFLADNNGTVLADFIGKFENIKHDWQTITGILGINLSLPHSNKGKYRDYREFYSRETKKKVERIYEKDIDLFKYTFNN